MHFDPPNPTAEPGPEPGPKQTMYSTAAACPAAVQPTSPHTLHAKPQAVISGAQPVARTTVPATVTSLPARHIPHVNSISDSTMATIINNHQVIAPCCELNPGLVKPAMP